MRRDERLARGWHGFRVARDIHPGYRRAAPLDAVPRLSQLRAKCVPVAKHRQSARGGRKRAGLSLIVGTQLSSPRQTNRRDSVELLIEPIARAFVLRE